MGDWIRQEWFEPWIAGSSKNCDYSTLENYFLTNNSRGRLSRDQRCHQGPRLLLSLCSQPVACGFCPVAPRVVGTLSYSFWNNSEPKGEEASSLHWTVSFYSPETSSYHSFFRAVIQGRSWRHERRKHVLFLLSSLSNRRCLGENASVSTQPVPRTLNPSRSRGDNFNDNRKQKIKGRLKWLCLFKTLHI